MKRRWSKCVAWVVAWWGRSKYLEAAIEEQRRLLIAERAVQDQRVDGIGVRLMLSRRRVSSLEKQLAQSLENDQPGLTPAEIERLAILAEYCGDVVQAVGKVLRHGYEAQSPYGGRPNRQAVEREIGNVRAAVTLMLDADDVRLAELQTWQRRKREGFEKWTRYQDCSMPREAQLEMMRSIELNRLERERLEQAR